MLLENSYRDEKQNRELVKLQEQTGLPVLWRAVSLYTGEIVEGATRDEMMARIGEIDRDWLRTQRKGKGGKVAGKKPAKKRSDFHDALAYHEAEKEFSFGYED